MLAVLLDCNLAITAVSAPVRLCGGLRGAGRGDNAQGQRRKRVRTRVQKEELGSAVGAGEMRGEETRGAEGERGRGGEGGWMYRRPGPGGDGDK